MRTKYKVIEEGIYFVTSSIINWINIFKDVEFRNIIIDELVYRRKNGQLKIYGFIIMPNHMHLIISSKNLSNVMRNIKSYTACKIIDKLKENENIDILNKFREEKQGFKNQSEFQVWQEGFHPKLIINDEEFEQKMNYIHYNPVKNELIDLQEKWKFSSYNNYNGGEIVMEIDLIGE